MAIASTNDKLRFLYGQQANLPATKSNGTVYVTTDERAMYVDINDQRIRLGDFQVFADFASIPTNPTPSESALVYAAAENILCRYDGSKWVQINSQKTLSQLLASVTTAYAASDNSATATHTFKDNAGGAATAKPQVKVSSGNADTVTVTADATNGIVIKAANTDTKTTAATTFETNAAVIKLTETTTGYDASGTAVNTSADGATITIKGGDGTTVANSNGAISIKTAPTTLKTGFDKDGKLTVEAVYSDGKTVNNAASAITPVIKVGTDSYSFANGTAELTGVYTSTEVDEKIAAQLKTAQAMVFKGVVSPTATLPDTAAHGEVWVVSEAGTIRNTSNTYSKSAVVGDFFIAGFKNADGQEGSDGLIAQNDLQWQYIPAGNDDQLSTVVTTGTNKLTISSKLGSATPTALGSVIVGNGLNGTVAGTGNAEKTLTIAHPAAATNAKDGTTGSTDNTRTITAIKSVTVDDYGHISSYETHTYTVPNEALNTVTNTVGGSDNAVTVTTKVTHSSGSSKEGAFTIGTSGNSAVKVYRESSSTSKVSIDLYWGSF